MLAIAAVRERVHLFTEPEITADMRGNGPLILFIITPGKTCIPAVHRMGFELCCQLLHRVFRFGDQQQPAGILIDPVHKAYARQRGCFFRVLLRVQVPGQPVQQRTGIVTAAGMYHHIGRLIDHHQHLILIDDIQGHLLGLYFTVFRQTGLIHDDLHTTLHLEVGLYGITVHQHHFIVNDLLYLVACYVFHAVHQVLIYAQRLHTLTCDRSETFYLFGRARLPGIQVIFRQLIRFFIPICHTCGFYFSSNNLEGFIFAFWYSSPNGSMALSLMNCTASSMESVYNIRSRSSADTVFSSLICMI